MLAATARWLLVLQQHLPNIAAYKKDAKATYHKDKKIAFKRFPFAHFGCRAFELVNNKLAPIQLLDVRKIHNGWVAPWANR